MFIKTNIEGLSVELQDGEVLLSYTGESRLLLCAARKAVFAALGVAIAAPRHDRWEAGEADGEQVQSVKVLSLHTAGTGMLRLEGGEKFVSMSRTETHTIFGVYEPDTHSDTVDVPSDAEFMDAEGALMEIFEERNAWIVDEGAPGEIPGTLVAWPVWLQ